MKKAIFLDRDGVINHDPGEYTKSVNEFHFLPNVFETLKILQDLNYVFVVITNQGGIAKGLYSRKDFDSIDRFMHGKFDENGINLLETFFCPHHPDFGRCLCRKPLSLMILKSLAKHDIDPASSFLIGDKERDILCAENAGVRGVLIPTNGSILDGLKKRQLV
jgi:D-glycero-D-manno-heptose 1,7-bisphosphate phosphatase